MFPGLPLALTPEGIVGRGGYRYIGSSILYETLQSPGMRVDSEQ